MRISRRIEKEFQLFSERSQRFVLERRWWARLWYRLTLPSKPRSRPYSRRRRGSRDGLVIIGLAFVLAAAVAVFHPALPAWLPGPLLRAGFIVEELKFVKQ